MNILHYSLGLYPDRQGGLVRYSTDLATEQSKSNRIIYMMPGRLGLFDKNVRIVKCKKNENIDVYKIENALPIPLFAGIKDVSLYTKNVEMGVYDTFLKEHNVDVIHIHSLMGLHVELLASAKARKIPILMTTHDFFGICPITTLYKNGDICESGAISEHCYACSKNAFSYYKLAIGQTNLYKKLKNSFVVDKIRKNVLADKDIANDKDVSPNAEIPNYEKLDKYYKKCFSLIDYYLFNSCQTRNVFESRLGPLAGEVFPLLLSTIKDGRKKRTFMKDGFLHVGYMGECKEFKGFFLIKQVVENLASEGYKIKLDVFNDDVVETKAIVKRGHYSPNELDFIYDTLDVVAVPSIWYETLSFIAIEAISSGMPCIVSDRVGAREFIKSNKAGFIVKAGCEKSLLACVSKIYNNPKVLNEINVNIIASTVSFEFEKHNALVMEKYNYLGNYI